MKILSLAFRSLLHFRFYSLINILGLALSLTCTVIIFRYVYGEFTVNHFNTHLDRTYVAVSDSDIYSTGKQRFAILTHDFVLNSDDNDDPKKYRSTKYDVLENIPGIEAIARIAFPESEEVDVSDRNFTAKVMGVDKNFFDVADYPLIAGAAGSIIPMMTAVITEDFAHRAFGGEDPLGKQIKRHNGEVLTVTGIVGDVSTKSSFDFDILLFGRTGSKLKEFKLIKLYPTQDYRQVERQINESQGKIKDLMNPKHFSSARLSDLPEIRLMPYGELYFTDTLENYPLLNFGNKLNVILLLTVGVLIMFIGCVNFINIYTAVIMRRGREFGMKKVFGADAGQIFMQMWVENLVMVTLSILLGMSFTELFSPVVRNILGLEQIPFSIFDYMVVVCVLLLLPLLTTLYPFFKYYYSSPVTSLRDVGKTGGRNLSRYVFLTIQYATAIFMIVLSIFFVRHLHRMINTDLGFRAHDIIKVQPIKKVFSMEGAVVLHTDTTPDGQKVIFYGDDSKVYEWDDMFIQRIKSSLLFENVVLGESSVNPGGAVRKFRIPGGEFIDARAIDARLDWLRLFEMIDLDEESLNKIEVRSVINPDLVVTGSFLRMFNIQDWRESRIEIGTENSWKIIGVVEDFNGFYLGKGVEPIAFMIRPSQRFHLFYNLTTTPLLASIVPGKRQEAIAFLSDLYDELAKSQFNYSFIEDEVRAMYDGDRKVAIIYSVFTIIAIFISMLGLFSMSLFDIEQRYNEIAIRKVNGATTGQIISMLLRKYLVLLSIAFVVAAPLAWLAITRYLEDFAFKTPVSWWIFALALVITAGVSLLTLIVQTKKAAETNPATVIRNE